MNLQYTRLSYIGCCAMVTPTFSTSSCRMVSLTSLRLLICAIGAGPTPDCCFRSRIRARYWVISSYNNRKYNILQIYNPKNKTLTISENQMAIHLHISFCILYPSYNQSVNNFEGISTLHETQHWLCMMTRGSKHNRPWFKISNEWKKEWASSHTPRSNIAWECCMNGNSKH